MHNSLSENCTFKFLGVVPDSVLNFLPDGWFFDCDEPPPGLSNYQDPEFDKIVTKIYVTLLRKDSGWRMPGKTDNKFTLHFIKNQYYSDVKKGMFHGAIGMQSIPITITEIYDHMIAIEAEKPVKYTKNDTFILLDLNTKKLHNIGNGKVI